jgi:hypothetical protein
MLYTTYLVHAATKGLLGRDHFSYYTKTNAKNRLS